MRKAYYYVKHYVDLFKKNSKYKVPLNWYKKLIFLKRGFLSEKYYLYELYKNNYKFYLSDFHTAQSRWINDPFTEILTNKYIFSKIIKNFTKVPEIYGIVVNGNYIPDKYDFDELKDLDTYVIKPILGGGGKNVYFITNTPDGVLINNKLPKNKLAFKEFIENLNNYLVCEYIVQSEFSKSLYKHSTNSMRILTLVDPETNIPFIARAVQRIGVYSSAPQDNFSKGGLSANINLITGELSSATTHPKNNNHVRYDYHPETNVPIKGQIIPNWEFVKKEINNFINKVPMLKLVGWDVLLTETGICIIEGNHHPDPDVIQCHEPLLTDKRIKKFYEHYNIVK